MEFWDESDRDVSNFFNLLAESNGKTVSDVVKDVLREYFFKNNFKKEDPSSVVRVIKGYLSPEECAKYSSMLIEMKKSGHLTLWGQAFVALKLSPEEIDFLDKHENDFIQICRETFNDAGGLIAEQRNFTLWPVGAEHQPHFDSNDLALAQQGVAPELRPSTPELVYSSILYLNDNYEGGEIYFPRLGLTIKPEAGDLVYFPSDVIAAEHGVSMVTSGDRTTIALWLQRP